MDRIRTAYSLMYFVSLMLTVAIGCERAKVLGKVTGRVTFSGKGVSPATVTFSDPRRGINVMARTDDEGRYQVVMAEGEGLPPGSYSVSVTPPFVDLPMGPALSPPPKKPNPALVPERFRRAETSNLRLEVKEGENVFDISMTP